MKNKIYFLIFFFIFCIAISPSDSHALTSSQYSSRHNCSKFELAGAHTDGSAAHVGCYNTFSDAHNAMVKNGAADLIVFDETGTTKIVDAQNALVDIMKSTTYLYESSNLNTRQYTSISGLASMGCADGAFISTNQSNYAAKVKFNGFTAWISPNDIEIVPVNWLKTKNYYLISSDGIKHYHTSNIQSSSASISANTIGPKPDMLSNGTYYSYDGNYFYTTLEKMLTDYKNGNYNNSVNKNNPYYNYYQYLSIHSKSTYSSVNIEDYVRNALGYSKSIYGYKASDGASMLSGNGTYFYNAQQKYGANALITFALGRNESGNGRSDIAIHKNNGFGLNAVDSNPNEAANYFPTFASSIYELSSLWLTYGMAYATDWRYFGPAFGNKQNGVNVKYATDAYWSEKMASNYYYFDKHYGLNDYNYYQLGITTKATPAYLNANTQKKIYDYPEYGDQLLIVGESGNYYKVMSDMNINTSGSLVGSKSDYKKNYNWNSSYVYVDKSAVKLINKAKNGYKDPSSVTKYKDSDYSYDLYVENATMKPRVAKLTTDTNYYHDSALTSSVGKKVLKDKLVMVYSAAYNSSGVAVSYLVTSDYFYNQKKWISASSISFISSGYGMQKMNTDGHYEWVCSKPIDSSTYKISGLYGGTYFPIVGEEGNWYKVPVSLDSNSNSYGYVLKSESAGHVDKFNYKSSNNAPVISVSNKTITQGATINLKDGVSATDQEDGNITSKIDVSGTVDTKTPGNYKITYKVTDSGNLTTSKEITVTVVKDEEPVITATDKEITINTSFDPKKDVSATDKEDKDLTSKIVVKENTVNTKAIGTYKVVYTVTDSYKHVVEKEIKVTVTKDNDPVINVKDKTISLNSKFDPKEGVSVVDKEDGDITKNLKIEGSADTTKLGIYKITYSITDSSSNKVSKTINVTVVEKKLVEKNGEFYLNSLVWNSNTKKYTISGYIIILGVNNESDGKYELILKNGDKTYTIPVDSWTKSIPFDLGKEGANSYSNSWFKDEIDLSSIPAGDYDLYMRTSKGDYYTEELVTNLLNNKIDRRGQDNKKGYSFKVQQSLKSKKIELNIRDGELITTSTPSTFRNMINDYDNMEFVNNKLHVVGTSYNYGGTYNTASNITRKIIFENINTYKRYTYNLNATNKGSYKVVSTDNKDKSYAWYDANIDISNLDKGTYSILVYTKTNDSEDYGEVSDIFASINKAIATINNKNYEISLNKNKLNRLELIVK